MPRALVVEKDEDGVTRQSVRHIDEKDLPEGDVTVEVAYSSLNYKDGLCIGPGGGLVRRYPHVPGIDLAGSVSASSNPGYASGDPVILTGWRVGETRWGGYAELARVRGEWLVPLPAGLTPRRAMAVGTAGLAAMLAILALEDRGIEPGGELPVLVTGASGGVGSMATSLLAARGYEVAAVTGRAENADYLRRLGASRIVPRDELDATVARPLEREAWAACIDAVGGPMLARVLGQIVHGGAVAAVGLAGGADLPAKVTPFLLRGIALLGIDSVSTPILERRRAWQRIASDLPMDLLDDMTATAALEDLPRLGAEILQGRVRGRIVVDPREADF